MQKVVLTYSAGYGGRALGNLQNLLEQGYNVKYVTKVNEDVVEYIVEKDKKCNQEA